MKTATLNRVWLAAARAYFNARVRGLVAATALMLAAANLFAGPTVVTLGGGNPSVGYAGYEDGSTLHQALFHTPCGLALDGTGQYLFVADRDNNEIRYLDLIAGQTWTFGITLTNLISKPVGVAVDADYNVYVLNRGKGTNGTVVSFDNFGDLIATNLSGLTNAGGIALDPAGDIFVTASNRIIKATPAGISNSVTTVTTVTNQGTSLQGIVVKHNGLLAVCDSGRNGILLIDPNTGIVTTNAGFHGTGDFTTNGNNLASSSSAKFNQPTSVTEAGDGTLIVSDYGNNRVKVVLASGVVTNLYGVTAQYWGGTYPGWYDGTVYVPDSIAPNVQSRLPFGVVFGPDGSIYTSEDYYHLIRKVTGANFALPPPLPPPAPTILTVLTNYGEVSLTWSSSAGATSYNLKRSPSSGGPYTTIINTAATSYTDTNVLNGTTYYYVVSALNSGGEGPNSAQVSATPPVPPVPNPQIGYVDFLDSSNTSTFHPVSSFTFFNDTPIVIVGTPGTATYYTYDGTTPNASSSQVSSDYQDGLYENQIGFYQVTQQSPSLTIEAIGEETNRPNSAVVTATFQFVTGNPNILGSDAAQFNISDITANAHLYYTLDGSDPSSTNGFDLGTVATSSNLWTVGFQIVTNTVFKVRAFRNNYQPSAIVSATFSPSNFVANTISFGFASGEASSAFIASPGQTFYAPVTLSILGNTVMYSLQFNLTVTNLGSAPAVAPGAFGFSSFLDKPIPGTTPVIYTNIPPAMFAGGGTFTNGVFTNSSLNLLGVGWVERAGMTNLYNTISQTLISFSQAHDVQFLSSGGNVEVGGFQFTVPANAAAGDTYQIQIGRPSATSDGIGAPGSAVYISASTNGVLGGGGMNALKNVTIGQFKYVVGDVYPFGWFNAGDFGKGYLNNADVEQVFEAAIYNLNTPPPGSDFFDAMDSCGNLGTNNGAGLFIQSTFNNPSSTFFQNNPSTTLFNGNDATINQIVFGDGVLDICDVYVTFRRSLDSSLTWYRRFWTNGVRAADTTNNVVPNVLVKASSGSGTVLSKAQSVPASTNAPLVNFTAGDSVTPPTHLVQIPITANILGSYPLRMLMLNLTVNPLDGSPALSVPVQFTQNATVLGTPYTTASIDNDNYAAVWLNSTNAGLTGTATIGTLTVRIPAGAPTNAAYAIHFDHASATPNGLASFPKQTMTGLITLASRTNSYYGDGIPDSWRLRWFGTIYNVLSVSNACASGDGVNNWAKYIAGVDPTIPYDFPSVNAKSPVPSGSTTAIHWPTVLGKQYAIERSTTLFSGSWTAIATNTGTGGDMEFDDANTGKVKFYRVRILP